eukprot:4414502-Amphidinium_carterae.3
MALGDDKVVDVLPRNISTGCAEASRRRPPPESSAKRLKVAQGATSTPPLRHVRPLRGCRWPTLACKEGSLPGPDRVQIKGNLGVSLDAALQGELQFGSSPELGTFA